MESEFRSLLVDVKKFFENERLKQPKSPPIVLFMLQTDGQCRTFLENVAGAMNKINLEASVIGTTQKEADALLKSGNIKLACVSTEDLQTLGVTVPAVHSLTRLPTSLLLTLAPLKQYLFDQELKKDLWTTIKNLASKNMLP